MSEKCYGPYSAAQGWEEMAAACLFPDSATSFAATAVLSQGMTLTPLRPSKKRLHWPQVRACLENRDQLFPQTGLVACQGIEGGNSQAACDKMFPRGGI